MAEEIKTGDRLLAYLLRKFDCDMAVTTGQISSHGAASYDLP
jgi:hypothetical protein